MTFNSKVLAQEGWYISPGVQIGIDSKGNLHRSAQVTLGLLIEPFTTGLTIGYKWFRKTYSNQSNETVSFIQPSNLGVSGDMKSWMLERYEIDEIEYE